MSVQGSPKPVTGKRKRNPEAATTPHTETDTLHITIGSYERVIHGFTAAVVREQPSSSAPVKPKAQKSPVEQPAHAPSKNDAEEGHQPDQTGVTFTDAFLIAPHSSSVRAVAVSPVLNGKRYLASGGADERINVYQIGAVAPPRRREHNGNRNNDAVTFEEATRLVLAGRELGTLTPHTATVTGLQFCGHAKLLSTGLDNCICVTRTRDWTPLTTLRAPHPQSAHRPDGDTYAPGDGPSGVTSCGVHPSLKLGVSVGVGERVMRLWDLVKGKKAGVLAFEKKVMQEIGELGTLRSGEGRQVEWDAKGEYFAIAFERGVALFDVGCKIQGVSKMSQREKVGCVRWLSDEVLAVATERGRIVLMSTRIFTESQASSQNEKTTSIPILKCFAQVTNTTKQPSNVSRIKDFRVFATDIGGEAPVYLVIGHSNGAVHITRLSPTDLTAAKLNGEHHDVEVPSVGELLATKDTGHRITCLDAFLMQSESSVTSLSSDGNRTRDIKIKQSQTNSHEEKEASQEINGLPLISSDSNDEHEVAKSAQGEGSRALDVADEDDDEDFAGFDDE